MEKTPPIQENESPKWNTRESNSRQKADYIMIRYKIPVQTEEHGAGPHRTKNKKQKTKNKKQKTINKKQKTKEYSPENDPLENSMLLTNNDHRGDDVEDSLYLRLREYT
jgi:hypothetical protein